MELTKSDIEDINSNCPNSEQGIYTEPYGIPVNIKEPVIYMRWMSGGTGGGNCWGDEHYDRTSDDKPKFEVLDLVLKKLKPNITYLDYRQIEKLIHTNKEYENEYYGNGTEYSIEYIKLYELYELISKL